MDSRSGLSSVWIRVDDRLIHGQVTVGWRQYLRYAQIWVVDEPAREDPYLQDALRLATPQGVTVRVYGVQEAIALLGPPSRRPKPIKTSAVGSLSVTPTEADKGIGGRAPGEGPEPAPAAQTTEGRATHLPPGAQTAEGGGTHLPPGAIPMAQRGGPRGGSVLLLVRSPETALALVEGGVPFDRLNVGNLSSRPGSVRVFKNISLTPAHAEALDALAEHGVRITFQLTPGDAEADWLAVRRRMGV
jgi:mannose/fructose/N-acetylgalactosamine-specific phosphotransferase system component IIB